MTSDATPSGDLTGGEALDEVTAALTACLMEIERHVAGTGWDQPPRLFALAPTAELAAGEPELAERLGLSTDADALALTPIEQDGFAPGSDLARSLAVLAWPDTVTGCAVVLEQTMVPPQVEAELPEEPTAAAVAAAEHPDRVEVRLVVGVHRDGSRHGLARFRSHPDELVGAPDLVPGLVGLLTATFDPEPGAGEDEPSTSGNG